MADHVGRGGVGSRGSTGAGGRGGTGFVGGRGSAGSVGSGRSTPTRQRNSNWNHNEVIALIMAKQKEYVAQKALVDPRARMVPTAQKWLKIAEEVQLITKSKVMRNQKMCKDKWNGLNSDYRKVADYGKGTGNHTSFWDLSNEDKDKFGLPRVFHSDFFNAIEAFQEEHVINTPLHLRDSQLVDESPDVPASDPSARARGSEPIINLSDSQNYWADSPVTVVDLDTPGDTPNQTPNSARPPTMGSTPAPRGPVHSSQLATIPSVENLPGPANLLGPGNTLVK